MGKEIMTSPTVNAYLGAGKDLRDNASSQRGVHVKLSRFRFRSRSSSPKALTTESEIMFREEGRRREIRETRKHSTVLYPFIPIALFTLLRPVYGLGYSML